MFVNVQFWLTLVILFILGAKYENIDNHSPSSTLITILHLLDFDMKLIVYVYLVKSGNLRKDLALNKI